ncbi:hypothetical protein NUW54_g10733 [Trametes sanguinea]|uniref:Uncharacterized protein n=1 Tax=Trametes sanguinea TaxID=158606 RepID=A0ACC1NTB9_9APHY|nr:hypothetical protein NUW54_g10733 [Trametes sanguinea]
MSSITPSHSRLTPDMARTYTIATATANPSSSPIAKCAADIQGLAVAAQMQHRAMRDTRRQLSRLNDPSRESLKAEWTTYLDRYERILNDSDVTASKLAAIVDVYLALQGNTETDKESAMVTELSTLQAELEKVQPSFNSECVALASDMKGFYSKATGSPPFHGLPGQDLTLTANGSVTPTTVQHAPERLWSFVLPAISSPSTSAVSAHTATNCPGSTLTSAQATAVDRFKHLAQAKIVVYTATGNLARSTQLADASPIDASRKLSNEVLTEAVKANAQALEAQAQQFSVFSELTQHLKNEIGAYLLSFQAAKAYPTMEKRKALANMHARVAASSAHWRQCSMALTDGYTRVPK